ncbi:MAG: thiamine pyrophosphate-dependent enzyme [Hyphomicrobium sp.]
MSDVVNTGVPMRTGGQIVADALVVQGVPTAFFVPGESFLGVLDAFFDRPTIRPIICRHEGSAVMMAEATGRLSGRPGVAFVTKGPGASNAVAGVYLAYLAETPLILFVGLPAQDILNRKAFQSCNVKDLFKSIAKKVDIAHEIEQLPDILSRAFALSLQGRRGPVVVGLPENILSENLDVRDCARTEYSPDEPSREILLEIEQKLSTALQPLVVVGGSGWSYKAQEDLQSFAHRLDLPVAAAFRAQDYIDNRHPSYVGHLGIKMDTKLATALRTSDFLLLIGVPLDEINTGRWEYIKAPSPSQNIIQVHPSGLDPNECLKIQREVVCSTIGFAAQLKNIKAPENLRWKSYRRDLRTAFETSQRPLKTPGHVQLSEIIRSLSERLPETAIIASGAGNYSQFVHRYFTYKGFGTSLAPVSGSMGYGLPAAIAAQLLYPERCVVAFAGDGCFQMSAQELGTAIQYNLPIIIIIADNGMFGTIRMHQESEYPGRVCGTSLVNPDFALFARSYGALGFNVNTTEDFEGAFSTALRSRKPCLIRLALDPEAITPQTTLREFHLKGLEKKKK